MSLNERLLDLRGSKLNRLKMIRFMLYAKISYVGCLGLFLVISGRFFGAIHC